MNKRWSIITAIISKLFETIIARVLLHIENRGGERINFNCTDFAIIRSVCQPRMISRSASSRERKRENNYTYEFDENKNNRSALYVPMIFQQTARYDAQITVNLTLTFLTSLSPICCNCEKFSEDANVDM